MRKKYKELLLNRQIERIGTRHRIKFHTVKKLLNLFVLYDKLLPSLHTGVCTMFAVGNIGHENIKTF